MSPTGLSSIRLRQQPIMTIAIITMTVLLVCGIRQVQGGCSRFGHSCFGAHGKRADLSNNFDESSGQGVNFDPAPSGYVQPPPMYMALPNVNNGRMISPYLMDWIMAAHRGELKSTQDHLKEDNQPLEMRKK